MRADATAALPIRTAGVDVVTAVLWLHMVDDPHGALQVDLHLAGAAAFGGYGYLGGAVIESVYPVLAFHRR
ncbi:MAG: hypothetical protein ACRDRF_23660 [Pseudonocardiaceae bacterium]